MPYPLRASGRPGGGVSPVREVPVDVHQVIVLGDSMAVTWPDELETALGSGYHVASHAWGSKTCEEIHDHQWTRSTLNLSYDSIVLFMGTAGISGRTAENEWSWTEQVIDEAIAAGLDVYVCGLLPLPVSGLYIERAAKHQAFNDLAIAKQGVTFVDLWPLFDSGDGVPDGELYRDTVHPSPDGDSVIADAVAAEILGQ